jgi:hypothetical protein
MPARVIVRIEELVTFLIEVLDEDTRDPNREPSFGWPDVYATGQLDSHALLHHLKETLVAV